jgi:hypothetical protein
MKTLTSTVALALLVALAAPAFSEAPKPLSVNDLVAQPEKHLGKVSVVGRVSAVTPGNGFTLVDSGNCTDCGSQCAIPKKIPLVWRGSAPAVKAVVVVKGVLSKTAKGMTLVADNVAPQRR